MLSDILSHPTTKMYNTRQEWEKDRHNGIGASEVGTVIGVNPYEGRVELWQRKTERLPAKPMSMAMKLGHLMEDAVAQLFAETAGAEIVPGTETDFVVYDTDKPYFRVSPDRYFRFLGSDEECVLECKTTLKKVDEFSIPLYWYAQLQYQLAVSNHRRGALAWLVAGRDFGYKLIERDDDYCRFLLRQVDDYWLHNIVADTCPDPVTVEDAARVYTTSEPGKTAEASAAVFSATAELESVAASIKQFEERKKELEDIVKVAFGDAETLTFNGRVIATYKTSKAATRFDTTGFKKEHPDLYAAYAKEGTPSRRLALKERN